MSILPPLPPLPTCPKAPETPQKLTKRQRELLAEFDKLSSEATQPESSGFLSRVKAFLGGLGNQNSNTD